VEQRIGRVHRLGQTRAVHAIHLTAEGSYEETVVARVIERAVRAGTALAADQTAAIDEEVAARVLDLPRAPAAGLPGTAERHSPDPLGDHSRREASRIAARRRLPGEAPAWTGGAWSPPRRGGGAQVVVVLEVTRHSATGWLRAAPIVALRVALTEAPAHRRAWRQVCQRLARDARIHAAAREAAASTAAADAWGPIRHRLAAIRTARHAGRRRQVQPSLFDRRALREIDQRAAITAHWDEWQERLSARLDCALGDGDTTRVVAVLPFRGR
jgi:hypothetical protein